jgi:hypothetical protein
VTKSIANRASGLSLETTFAFTFAFAFAFAFALAIARPVTVAHIAPPPPDQLPLLVLLPLLPQLRRRKKMNSGSYRTQDPTVPRSRGYANRTQAAQRQRSTASSGPAALPSPRQADISFFSIFFFFFSFFYSLAFPF